MPTNFQYRLQQYESVPPAGSWSQINARLDAEFDVDEIKISEKLTASATTAPSAMWDRISAELDSNEGIELKQPVDELPILQTEPESRSRLVPIKFLRVAAAAIICIAVTTLYFLMNGNNGTEQVSFVDATEQSSRIPEPAPARGDTAVRLAEAVPLGPSQNRSIRQYVRSRSNNGLPVVQTAFLPEEPNEEIANSDIANDNINYADVNDAEKFHSAGDINIPSHPILDREGNIIMDEKLVSAPDGNYVTVTGPNGEQTKISKKFLHALSYMNAGSNDEDYMGILLQEGSLWKWLFQEWRKKLLHQPSFIPTATNFLDIMELKEILHENF
jgi:hypothetical protein